MPFDELFVFYGGLGWCFIFIYVYTRDRNKMLNTLQSSNEELIEKTNQLQRFTYIASHDLKSPLRTISSFVGLMQKDIEKKDYEKLESRLDFVKSGAMQMTFLIEDVLEISRISNHSNLKKEHLNLSTIIQKAINNLREEIEEKNAQIKVADLPGYIANDVEFLLLFQNIIQNGIKYNESQPPIIDINSTQHDGFLYITIEDNGIGIDSEYHDSIFEFFTRLHTQEIYQGTGLGLGLCKRIVNNYQGDISLTSSLNDGSIFTIKLPLE